MDPLVTPVADVASSGFYFSDPFTGVDVLDRNWISKSGSGAEAVLTARSTTAKPPGGIAGVDPVIDTAGNGVLRLTNAAGDQDAFVLYDQAFASNRGVNVTFDLFAYGGTGADGLSFFLIDGSTPGADVSPGAFGGSLGYASSVANNIATGLTNGYLGIGFDAFGNFSNPLDSAAGGPGLTPDAIAVRGNAAGGYQYLTGTPTLTGGIDNTSVTDPANRGQARRMVEIDLTADGLLDISIDLDNNGLFEANERVINDFNVVAVNGRPPATYKFGFAASTGGSTNIHELRNLAIAPSKTSNGGTLETSNPVSFGEFGVGLTYVENAVPGTIAQALTIEGDPGTITSATVQIRNNRNSAQDILTIGGDPATGSGTIGNLNWAYAPASGTLTFTGTGTATEYRDALRQVAYANTSDAPTTGARTVRYSLLNGTTPITLRDTLVQVNPVNDLPTAVTLPSTTVPINQPGAVVGTLNITDPDGPGAASTYQAFTVTGGNDKFEVVGDPTNGFRLKLKPNQSVTLGETIPPITVSFTDVGAPNGGAVSQGFNLTAAPLRSEIFWRNSNTQEKAFWYVDAKAVGGPQLVGAAAITTSSRYDTNWRLAGVADFDGDGVKDHVYQRGDATAGEEIGYLLLGQVNGQTATVKQNVTPVFNSPKFGVLNGQAARPDLGWDLVGAENMSGGPEADLIFYSRSLDRLVYWTTNSSGQIVDGGYFTSSFNPDGQGTGAPNTWNVEALGDFTGDGKVDVLWRDSQGTTVLWRMDGTTVDLANSKALLPIGTNFEFRGVGDFNGDRIKDVVWRDRNQDITRFWRFDNTGTPVQTEDNKAIVGGSQWQIQAIADMNGDDRDDILWRDTQLDRSVIWNMNLNSGPIFDVSSVLPGSGLILNFLTGGNEQPYINGDLAWNIDAANGIPSVLV